AQSTLCVRPFRQISSASPLQPIPVCRSGLMLKLWTLEKQPTPEPRHRTVCGCDTHPFHPKTERGCVGSGSPTSPRSVHHAPQGGSASGPQQWFLRQVNPKCSQSKLQPGVTFRPRQASTPRHPSSTLARHASSVRSIAGSSPPGVVLNCASTCDGG